MRGTIVRSRYDRNNPAHGYTIIRLEDGGREISVLHRNMEGPFPPRIGAKVHVHGTYLDPRDGHSKANRVSYTREGP